MTGKNRYVNTRFWSDSWIVNRDIIERYLFLYFLTNEHTNIAGIYELPIRTLSHETGIEKDHIEKIIPRFIGKIYYFTVKDETGDESWWVYVKNFAKHQAVNDSIRKGIEAVNKSIPPNVLAKIREYQAKK